MNKSLKLYILLPFLIICSVSCEDKKASITKASVVENYGAIVYKSYKDCYDSSVIMQQQINSFIENPSEANLDLAKKAWLNARNIYGQTEVYRECNGPIDTQNDTWGFGHEGRMNAWPIDESYIDYVSIENPDTTPFANSYKSIISDEAVAIDKETLSKLNESKDDKSISTGWHAIEFLLWGQDNTLPNVDLAGQRKYTDYTEASANYKRRGQYLQVVTDLLVSDLKGLVKTWSPAGKYRKVFDALDTEVALKQLLTGATFLAGDELSSERIIAPVNSTDGLNNSGQEDEQSCFSDNTHNDIWANAQGVYNVVFGKYDTISGTSFFDLVKAADGNQANILKEASDLVLQKVNVIKNNDKPFDYLITKENVSDTSFGPVMQTVEALKAWADVISESASKIGVSIK